MARQKLSRNDPCPCGSGKKYKHCHYGQDIDWSARTETAWRPVLPRLPPKPNPVIHGPWNVVDTKLKAIAQATPGPAEWKHRVERLSDATTTEDRMQAYKAVREAKVIPNEAAEYLLAWAIQWLPPEASQLPDTDEEDEQLDEEGASRALDQETLAGFRKFGIDDLAKMYVTDRLEYDRRHERGRHYFYGPPDELLAERLREKGIID